MLLDPEDPNAIPEDDPPRFELARPPSHIPSELETLGQHNEFDDRETDAREEDDISSQDSHPRNVSRGSKAAVQVQTNGIHTICFPKPVATPLYQGHSKLKKLKLAQSEASCPPYHPFESVSKWKFAKFLVKSPLSQGDIDQLLHLDIVCHCPIFKHINTYIIH